MTAPEGIRVPVVPSNPTQRGECLRFSLSLIQTLPVARRHGLDVEFGPSAYRSLFWKVDPFFPFTLEPNATTDVSAQIGASPEPADLVLLGTGFLRCLPRAQERRSQTIRRLEGESLIRKKPATGAEGE